MNVFEYVQGTIAFGEGATVVAAIVLVLVVPAMAVVVVVVVAAIVVPVVPGMVVVVVVDAKKPVVVGLPLHAAVHVDSELQCAGVMPHQPHFERQCWSVLQGFPVQVL